MNTLYEKPWLPIGGILLVALILFVAMGQGLRNGSANAVASTLSPNRQARMQTYAFSGPTLDVPNATLAAVVNPQPYAITTGLVCRNGAGLATAGLPAMLVAHAEYTYKTPRVSGVLHCSMPRTLRHGERLYLTIAVLP
jgi:hypothetical protein